MSHGGLSYKQAETHIANEVWKLVRTAKCPPNVPVTLLLITVFMFRRAQGERVSWPVLAGSHAAPKRVSTWEKPVGRILELRLVLG